MHLLELTVNNFGVFRGQYQFDLRTLSATDAISRHLTVISGHNGAGKSTLFQAMALALHGSLVLGDRVSREDYDDFLLGRMHRYSDGEDLIVSDQAFVMLLFQYVKSGRCSRIEVKRSWERSGRTVQERLKIRRNGQMLTDVEPGDYQTWLNGIMPPGLRSICFFDAEQLEALSSPDKHSSLLAGTLRRLLGLDLVSRLQSDLMYWMRRQGGGEDVKERRRDVFQEQDELDALAAELEQVRDAVEENRGKQDEIETRIRREERRLASEGGRYAARRPVLKERLETLEQEIQKVASQLHELCAGLLPFALVPELCQTLDRRLKREADLRRRRAADQMWQKRVSQVRKELEGELIWRDLGASPELCGILTERLIAVLRDGRDSDHTDDETLVHHLSGSEQDKLQDWIALALHAIPQQAQTLSERLRGLQKERTETRDYLDRAPDDQLLAPIHEQIMRLEDGLATLREKQFSLKEQIGSLEFQYEEQERDLQRSVEKLKDAQANERQLALAEKSKVALQAYEDALTRQRLGMLEERLVEAFNTVCHKDQLLTGARIEPEDFDIELRGVDGHAFELAELSAGERQLYALSLLWGLRQVGGQQLPLIVDAPLARLDEAHRYRLLSDYIPEVSDQVVLFTTDAELDDGLLNEARPYLARVYELSYDVTQQSTDVNSKELSPFPAISRERRSSYGA